jgi:hypothetical protein
VVGSWRRLHNEEIYNLYVSPTIIRGIKSRRIRWAGHVERMGALNILVGKLEGSRPRRRPIYRWEHNIRMGLCVRGWEGVDWMNLAQVRDQWRALVNTVMNLRLP